MQVGNPAVNVVCPDIHDLAASKLAAGRDKDFDYASVLLERAYVTAQTLLRRVGELPIEEETRARIRAWVGAVARRRSQ